LLVLEPRKILLKTARFIPIYSPVAAGSHGRLLAQRHIDILPELRDMVVARTKNIDDFLLDAIGKGAKQIVFVGVGFDFRAFRLMNNQRDIKIFELDLPHMLVEREKIISTFANSCSIQRYTIGINLELEDVADKLLASTLFDPLVATCFIVEGASMYFDENVNRRILTSLRRIMSNSLSMLWIDVVAQSVIQGTTGYPSVENFVKGMEKLGEPFIFGLNDSAMFSPN
jgi:methyltransferase (TIGR00027 family)